MAQASRPDGLRRRRIPLKIHLRWLGLAFALATVAGAAELPPPWESQAVSVESGMLWQVGKSTPIDYRLVPTQISWRSREFLGRAFQDGSHFAIRHRLTLQGVWIARGPESRYIGIGGSPSFEWWNQRQTLSFHTGVGGGIGWIDSRGVRGGQGQDFTLHWYARAGLEFLRTSHRHWSVGILFQHMSNGGRTDPNPGIDALGFMVGHAWQY